MNFLYPNILWGLLAVFIPVIIHLFNFRRFRKVYFTNVRYLEELKQQTRRQSQLRHLLVMIARMLAIAALVFAFAQPYIPVDDAIERPDAISQVSIYIDNSFSMEALASAGPLLDIARMKAREIALAYSGTDQFMLLTNDFEGRHQRWVSQEEFLQMLDDIAVSPVVRTVPEVMIRQGENYYTSSGKEKITYLISDFQRTMADFANFPSDSTLNVRLVPVQAIKRDNLYIDSCWFVSPVHQLNQSVKLVVRVINDATTRFEKVPLKLSVNGAQKALASFDIQPGAMMDVELPFTSYEPGIQSAVVELSDYPVVFDDRMYLVYRVAEAIPVLSINGRSESPYLNSLFGKDAAFAFVNNSYTNIDYNRLREFELIILNELDALSTGLQQELMVYLENGGNLLVIPSPEADMLVFRDFLTAAGANAYGDLIREETRVSAIDQQNQVYADVFETGNMARNQTDRTDLPEVRSYFEISRALQTSRISVMTLLNGKPFLTREMAGNGIICLLAVPLGDEFSNFARHALFVPTLYRIALLSAATDPLYYVIGRDTRIDLSNPLLQGDMTLKIVSASDDYEFIPGMQTLDRKLSLRLYNQVLKAGHYRLMKGEEQLNGLGFNYNRSESAMACASPDDLRTLVGRYNLQRVSVMEDKGMSLTKAIKDINEGVSLWKLFVILALAFAALEIILLRFWRSMS